MKKLTLKGITCLKGNTESELLVTILTLLEGATCLNVDAEGSYSSKCDTLGNYLYKC